MPSDTLQTTSERVGDDRVKLRVEVPETMLGPSIDAAYKRWANEIKVPGFRKGKVPRRLIDARVGPEAVRDQALRDALPDLYREALESEDLHAIAPPDIEVVSFEPGAGVVFEATVDVRPEIELPDLAAITIDAPPGEVTDEDVAEQLERLRDRFAELESTAREARTGDFVLIDLKGYQHDEPVEGASAPDLLYEIASQTGPPRLDKELEGSRPGTILKFSDEVVIGREGESPGESQEVAFTVLVKEVKTKKLPPLDDDFAKTVGEFDTLDDLKNDLRGRLGEFKTSFVEEEIRRRALEALVERSDLRPPQVLVESEFTHRLEHLEADLKRAGMTLDDYGRQTQLTELELRRDIREQAGKSVKAELLLEEIARREQVEVADDDVMREIAVLAAQSGRDPKELAGQIVESRRLGALAADIMRRKALDYVARAVNVVGRVAEKS